MKILSVIAGAVFLLSVSVFCHADEINPKIDGRWAVIGFEFARISGMDEKEAKSFLGQELEKDKGFLVSPFGSCNFCSLNVTYQKVKTDDLLNEDFNFQELNICPRIPPLSRIPNQL
ncbi:MAG: hypothetical protein Q8M45_05390 [Methylotenera sp.]|nr:hypothetical protein [Methylotenera sp.]MDP3207332.1 hypothetical protein [Methylotenera sp.]